MDEHVNKFSWIIDGEFNGSEMEKASAIMADEVLVEGVVSDLGRVAQEMESIGVGVEKGGYLEEGNGAHGQGKIGLEEADSVDNFILSKGSRGASKEAGHIVEFDGLKITKNEGMNLMKVEGHVGRLRMVCRKLKVFEK